MRSPSATTSGSGKFQRDPEVVGRDIDVNNRPMRIVGVLPKNFHLYLGPGVIPSRVDIWYPLSIIGVYAVVAYATARRTREIAVRLALGADTSRIVSLVMRQGAVWIAAGLIAGVVGARLLTGYVSGLLFKVTQTDVLTFGSVALGLAIVAAVATAVPALRASHIDPMLSLKAE